MGEQIMSKKDDLAKTAETLLDPGERLLAFTVGSIGESPLESLVVLTSLRIRLASGAGGPSIELSNIKRISWSVLWARLNIQTKSPKKKYVISVYGGEWKNEAKRLSELAGPMLPAS
jgi:hypothetical protein